MLNGLELGNAAFLALNVLEQSTKIFVSGRTSRAWANVNLVLMHRACEMLVGYYGKLAMAYVGLAGSVAGMMFGIVAVDATGEQARRVGEEVVCVDLRDSFVDSGEVDSRWANTDFEMTDNCGANGKFLATVSRRADDIPWTMVRGIKML